MVRVGDAPVVTQRWNPGWNRRSVPPGDGVAASDEPRHVYEPAYLVGPVELAALSDRSGCSSTRATQSERCSPGSSPGRAGRAAHRAGARRDPPSSDDSHDQGSIRMVHASTAVATRRWDVVSVGKWFAGRRRGRAGGQRPRRSVGVVPGLGEVGEVPGPRTTLTRDGWRSGQPRPRRAGGRTRLRPRTAAVTRVRGVASPADLARSPSTKPGEVPAREICQRRPLSRAAWTAALRSPTPSLR